MPNDIESERAWPLDKNEELVIAIDVGTTQSAVCIVHLVPGVAPKFKVVQSWPSSPNSSKIPTTIIYDQDGQALAFGAEAEAENFASDVSEGLLNKAAWFKLWLHPSIMPAPPYFVDEAAGQEEARNDERGLAGEPLFEVPPLPVNTDVKKCYTDMIRYLFVNAKKFFLEHEPDGGLLWDSLGSRVQLVLAHPNGWGPSEQQTLRQSILESGILSPSDQKLERLHLVTEAEASVHFGVYHVGRVSSGSNSGEGWLTKGSSFVVVDAGGSTVDTCVYLVKETSPKLILHEARASDCTQSGAIFVSRRMDLFLREKLKGTQYGSDEYVRTMVEKFDGKNKLEFKDADEVQIIKFGMNADTLREVGIAKGRLTLTGAEVESVFAPAVDTIVRSITTQIKGLNVKHILLVGGFGESPYLKQKIRATFEKKNIRVVNADEPSKKAVAEGAAIFYARNNVGARVTRFEFGLATNRPFDAALKAKRPVIIFESKKSYYAGGWTRIVAKGVAVETDALYKESFWVHKKSTDSLQFSTTIISYDGDGPAAEAHNGWSQDDLGKLLPGFKECCVVTANLSPLANITPIKRNAKGEKYRELDFEVGLWFGSTQLKACILWKDGDIERRGEAIVFPPGFV